MKVRDWSVLTREEIQRFPKVELHCHLDGSIRPETLQQIAKAQGLPISDNLDEVKEQMRAPKTTKSLEDYLSCFNYVLPYLQQEIALEMAGFDVVEQAALDGVSYIEIRFAPSLCTNEGLSVRDVLLAVLRGIAKGEETYPVTANLIVSGMRQDNLDKLSKDLFEVTKMKHEKIVGYDLAGPELDGFVPNYKKVLSAVINDQEIQLTLHAGECGCGRNVMDAVAAGAKRIGHGIALKGNPENQALCKTQNVCIEGCPSSNVQTQVIGSIQEYPLEEWLDSGLHFCINTDNRTVSQTTVTNEYHLLSEAFGLTLPQLRRLTIYGIEHSFATEEVKQYLRHKVLTYKDQ